MNLFLSVIATVLITFGIWQLALVQPQAKTFDERQIEQKIAQADDKVINPVLKPVKKPAKIEMLEIVGMSQWMELGNTDALWAQFAADEALHGKLNKAPNKLYILYQNINEDYTKALITVGYSMADMNASRVSKIVALNQYKSLSNAAYKADSSSLWQKINYTQALESVLEIHQLDSQFNPVKTNFLVSYKKEQA